MNWTRYLDDPRFFECPLCGLVVADIFRVHHEVRLHPLFQSIIQVLWRL